MSHTDLGVNQRVWDVTPFVWLKMSMQKLWRVSTLSINDLWQHLKQPMIYRSCVTGKQTKKNKHTTLLRVHTPAQAVVSNVSNWCAIYTRWKPEFASKACSRVKEKSRPLVLNAIRLLYGDVYVRARRANKNVLLFTCRNRQNHDMVMGRAVVGYFGLTLTTWDSLTCTFYPNTRFLLLLAHIEMRPPWRGVGPVPSRSAARHLTCWATTAGVAHWGSQIK